MFAEVSSADIALFALAFAIITWLLGLSFFLGRYSRGQDSLADSVETIFEKLDGIALQGERIARLEERRCDKCRNYDPRHPDAGP